jgi:hypothetical protein
MNPSHNELNLETMMQLAATPRVERAFSSRPPRSRMGVWNVFGSAPLVQPAESVQELPTRPALLKYPGLFLH